MSQHAVSLRDQENRGAGGDGRLAAAPAPLAEQRTCISAGAGDTWIDKEKQKI